MSGLEKKNCLQEEFEKVTDSKHSSKVATSSEFSSIQKIRMEDLAGGSALEFSFAFFFIKFITVGLGRISSFFFVSFTKIIDFNRRTASILFSDKLSISSLLDLLVGISGRTYAACEIMIYGGTGVTMCFAAYFCTATWRSVLWYRVKGLCVSLGINLLKLIIAQSLYKRYVFATGIIFSLRYVRFLVFLLLLEDFLSIHGIEDTFLIVQAILLYITFTLLKNEGMQKIEERPSMKESLDNLLRKEGGDAIYINKLKVTPVKEFTPNRLTCKITKEYFEEEIKSTSVIKTSIRSVNEYTPKKCTLRDTIRKSYSYPDMKFLKENSELVIKIINFKKMDSSNPRTEVSQNAVCIMDEIERLCSSLRNSQLVSQFHTNLRHSKRNLFAGEDMVYLKVPCDQRYGSFHFRRESSQTETPRRHSLPDFSKLAVNGSRTCLNKLYNLELNKQQIIATYPEEKEQIVLVLTELCKLNKLNL